MSTKEKVAQMLLKAGAVTLRPQEPFVYASGIKSPIYTDNRILISLPNERKEIVSAYCEMIKKWKPDVIAGVATAGIPWAAWISAELGLPMIFVRLAAKDHGKNNQIEGRFKKGDKIVVIEDLVSTGVSTIGVVDAVKQTGGNVLGCAVIFTYGLKKSVDAFKNAKVELACLSDFQTLVDVAVKNKYLDSGQKKLVLDWADDPDSWGAK
ncbi:MAG: orotate phosphoribosyltransferase [Nanoarchaeota archaeon]|nr:MAG: orotate phosphoribosyltransferase [Nanoarchaeota archaeon]